MRPTQFGPDRRLPHPDGTANLPGLDLPVDTAVAAIRSVALPLT